MTTKTIMRCTPGLLSPLPFQFITALPIRHLLASQDVISPGAVDQHAVRCDILASFCDKQEVIDGKNII